MVDEAVSGGLEVELIMSRYLTWILLFTLALYAQVNTATLLGTVKDPTGASVPNATVVVKSLGTGQERTVVTDSTGNGGRNILRADRLVQFDISVMKRFRFTERDAVELRGEAFNLSNTPTFSAPSTTINVASGAQVGSTLNVARTLELALKVFF